MPEIAMLAFADRLASFSMWSPGPVSFEDLAAAGFYAVTPFGRPDVVRCFHCGVLDGLWTSGADPLTRHVTLSPTCDIARLKRRAARRSREGKENKSERANNCLPGSRST